MATGIRILVNYGPVYPKVLYTSRQDLSLDDEELSANNEKGMYWDLRGGFRGGFGAPSPRLPPFAEKFICPHYHQPLSSLYMLHSVCQTPL